MVDFAKLRAEKKGTVKMDEPKWELVPYGEHKAVCIDVLQFEAQKWTDKDGGRIFNTKVLYLVWLVYPENETGSPIWNSAGQPFLIDRQFNPTLDPQNKYGCYQLLKDWAGRELTEYEMSSKYDLTNLIGSPGKITISHKQAKSGTVYAVVDMVEPIGLTPAELEKFMGNLRADFYKPRDYSFELKPRMPVQGQAKQSDEPNAWEPNTKDGIPF